MRNGGPLSDWLLSELHGDADTDEEAIRGAVRLADTLRMEFQASVSRHR